MAHPERLAWAAGIFEGEGSISRIRRGQDFDLQIAINMTDRDVLARFDEIVARGWLLSRRREQARVHGVEIPSDSGT